MADRMPEDLRALGQMVATHNEQELAGLGVVEAAARSLIRVPRRGRRRSAFVAVGAVVATAAAAAAVFALTRPAPPMTFVAAGSAGAVGEWLHASPSELPLMFSDGSSLLSETGSRLRVGELTPDGAAVELERGTIAVSVRHRERSSWRFRVGPFALLVTGTRFDASWNPETQSIEITVHDGSVRVSGPQLPEQSLVAGQQLWLSLERSPAARETPTSSPPPAVADPGAAPNTRAVRPAAPRPDPSWNELAQRGDYEAGLSVAERVGFESLCRSLPAHALLELGDTARFARRDDRAEQAYLAVRERFASSASSARAAFDLGVIARGSERARWFESYLQEAPDGPLTREALGRLIELGVGAGDRAGARRYAERYLRSFPEGPHAGLARELLASPSPASP